MAQATNQGFRYPAVSSLVTKALTTKTARVAIDRLWSPEETLARVLPVVDKMGITRIANLTGLDRIGVPVVAVTRPNSRSVAVALGKGFTPSAAKASGVMEAIESFHAEHIDLPLLLNSYDRLRERSNVVDVARLPRVSVGAFQTNTKLLWVEGHDLLRDAHSWIPYEVVHSDYTLPLPPGSGAFLMSSNGIASGNHRLEAISHAICEVVERDANALWRFLSSDAQAATRLDLRSVEDEACAEVLARFEAAEIDALVWDTTTDVGIPSFRCEISDRPSTGYYPLHPVAGYGCHPRREVALMRALTEAAQGRLTLISGARDDLSQKFFHDQDALQKAQRAVARRRGDGLVRSFQAVPTWDATTIEDDVTWELERLTAAGFHEVAVVDLTKRKFNIPVVRVVVPGLESICEAPGYVPGARLRQRIRRVT